MLSFIRNPRGRAEASEGTHDDLVMSLAIGYEALHQLPMNKTTIVTNERMDEDLAFYEY
jgi:hypothetical protein